MDFLPVWVCAGSQHVITYTTVHGLIIGWDLRAPRIAWKLENNPKHGKHFNHVCYYILLLQQLIFFSVFVLSVSFMTIFSASFLAL